jgi:hypothetical protein
MSERKTYCGMILTMSEQSAAAEQAVARYAAVVRSAHEEVVAAINAIPDPQEALTHANSFFKEAEAAYKEAAELRTQTVGRIWEAKELSLTALADLAGVTRQRVGQIVDGYEKGKTAGEEALA